MNKNKVFSIILSVALLSVGQSFCAQSPNSVGGYVSYYMHKVSPKWMTDFISKYLPSRQHKMVGALTATVLAGLAYYGYKTRYGAAGSEKPKTKEPEKSKTPETTGTEKPETAGPNNPSEGIGFAGLGVVAEVPKEAEKPGVGSGKLKETKAKFVFDESQLDTSAGSTRLESPAHNKNVIYLCSLFEDFNFDSIDNKEAYQKACETYICDVFNRTPLTGSWQMYVRGNQLLQSITISSGAVDNFLVRLKCLIEDLCPQNKMLPKLKENLGMLARITSEYVREMKTSDMSFIELAGRISGIQEPISLEAEGLEGSETIKPEPAGALDVDWSAEIAKYKKNGWWLEKPDFKSRLKDPLTYNENINVRNIAEIVYNHRKLLSQWPFDKLAMDQLKNACQMFVCPIVKRDEDILRNIDVWSELLASIMAAVAEMHPNDLALVTSLECVESLQFFITIVCQVPIEVVIGQLWVSESQLLPFSAPLPAKPAVKEKESEWVAIDVNTLQDPNVGNILDPKNIENLDKLIRAHKQMIMRLYRPGYVTSEDEENKAIQLQDAFRVKVLPVMEKVDWSNPLQTQFTLEDVIKQVRKVDRKAGRKDELMSADCVKALDYFCGSRLPEKNILQALDSMKSPMYEKPLQLPAKPLMLERQ